MSYPCWWIEGLILDPLFFNYIFPLVWSWKVKIFQLCRDWVANETLPSNLLWHICYSPISDTFFSQIFQFFQLTLMRPVNIFLKRDKFKKANFPLINGPNCDIKTLGSQLNFSWKFKLMFQISYNVPVCEIIKQWWSVPRVAFSFTLSTFGWQTREACVLW